MLLLQLLWFLLFLFIPLNGLDSATSPPTTTLSPEQEGKKQKAAEYFKAINQILEGFDPKIPPGKSMKQIMSGSAKIGPIIYHGFPWSNVENSYISQADNLKIQLLRKFENETMNAQKILMSPNEENVWLIHYQLRSIALMKSFFKISTMYYGYDNLNGFKTDCRRELTIYETFVNVNNELHLAKKILEADGYTDVMYDSLYTMFQNIFKINFAVFPLCNYLATGAVYDKPTKEIFFKKIRDGLTDFHYAFPKMKADQRKYYFSYPIIKKIVVNEQMNENRNGYDIARNIFNKLNSSYSKLNYDYYVIVKNATRLGYDETLIQCATDCHYFYNFFEKDIYVIRARRAQKYQKCDYVSQIKSDAYDQGSLVPLANEIIQNCKDIAALAIVRDPKDVQIFGISDGIVLYDIGKIKVVIAYYPLE